MPPGDQKGLCTRRAEEACNANIAKNQLALYQNKIASHEINSPNANVEQVRSEQKVVTSGRETPSEGVAPSVGNAGEKLAGGESAPLAGGESAPLAGGESAPLAGGEGAPLAGGEGAPLAGGEGAPLAGGEGAPLAGGEGAPLAGGEGAPLAGGEGAPLAAGVQQLEPQGQDAAADTLQGDEENTKNRDTVAVDTLTSPDNKEGEMNGETIQAGTVEKVVNNVLAKIGVAAAENSTSTTAKTNSTENTGAAKHNVTEMKGEAELDKDKVEEGPDQITPHPVKADDKTSLMNDVTDGVNEVPAQTDDDGTTPLDLEGLGKVTVKGDS
ncbi:hypothetical protein EB796_012202 [Bugula neritina]|uniref:Uncharacterized protein n=1 Tax=Bugula neritina TaxID=10212 RepID=A0A7J7JUB2_BUGNE|nr:hypothetical protein EB796_012202 [Bugula neritina]